MTRYQNPKLQQHFDLFLTFARNGGSELFTADGGQRGGANHRKHSGTGLMVGQTTLTRVARLIMLATTLVANSSKSSLYLVAMGNNRIGKLLTSH